MRRTTVKTKAAPRGHKIDFRVNDDEQGQIQTNASACGLTISDYCRKVTLGYKPKYRMTEHETEAFGTLADARGDIIKLMSALRGLADEQRLAVFRNDVDFMRKWLAAVSGVLAQWDAIVEELKD